MTSFPQPGGGARPPGSEPTRDELARGIHALLSDPSLETGGVPDGLRDEILRQVSGSSTARLALLKARVPFETVVSAGELSGAALLEIDGHRREIPFRIRRSDAADTFAFSLDGVPLDLDQLALVVGDLQLAPVPRGLTASLRIPSSWLPPTIDPMAAFAMPSRRDASHHTVQGKFDSGGPDKAGNPVEAVFLERSRQLQVSAPVDADQDEDAVVAEIDWPAADDGLRKDVHVVRLRRDPRWPRHVRLRRGTVDLIVPEDVQPGTARVTVRNVGGQDLPRRLEAVYRGRTNLFDLPLIVEGGQHRFRVRYEDERAALAAAGQLCLLDVSSHWQEGDAP